MNLADLMVAAMDHEEAGSDTAPPDRDASETNHTGKVDEVPEIDEDDDEQHQWRYPTLAGWVHDWLVPTLERDRNKSTLAWCSWWWKHPEAVTVLGALWHQWEASQDQPWTGMSSYLAYYHFPLLERLTRPDGPFGPCWTETRSTRTPTHREHDQHYGPPAIAAAVNEQVIAELDAAADWMPPRTA